MSSSPETPTAHPEDKWAEYRAGWQQRQAEKRQELLARHARAEQAARAAAQALRQRFAIAGSRRKAPLKLAC